MLNILVDEILLTSRWKPLLVPIYFKIPEFRSTSSNHKFIKIQQWQISCLIVKIWKFREDSTLERFWPHYVHIQEEKRQQKRKKRRRKKGHLHCLASSQMPWCFCRPLCVIKRQKMHWICRVCSFITKMCRQPIMPLHYSILLFRKCSMHVRECLLFV